MCFLFVLIKLTLVFRQFYIHCVPNYVTEIMHTVMTMLISYRTNMKTYKCVCVLVYLLYFALCSASLAKLSLMQTYIHRDVLIKHTTCTFRGRPVQSGDIASRTTAVLIT